MDAEQHNKLAVRFAREGYWDLALEHYAHALQLRPDYVEAHYNLGLLFLKKSKYDAAIVQFKNVIQFIPDHISAHFYLANLYLHKDDNARAMQAFLTVLRLDPFHLDAHNNLGAMYLKKGESLEAIRSFSNVLRIDETHLEARYNLAAILLDQSRYREASWHYEQILKHHPHEADSLYNLGVALLPQGLLEEAIACFEKILHRQPKYLDARVNLAAALMRLERREAAIAQYKKILEIDPAHPFADYLLNAMTAKKRVQAAPVAYVQHLFDNYAAYFDAHVQQSLRYETPQQLKQLFMTHVQPIEKKKLKILDLGCGTGLSGLAFKDDSSYMVGIDLSEKMLDKAREKNVYQELRRQNINTMSIAESYDMIIAADTFVYIGDLSDIFQTCYQLCTGYFLFSTEFTDEAGEEYILQKTARYAHSKSYIIRLATESGFRLMGYARSPLRFQNDQFLNGDLYLFSVAD